MDPWTPELHVTKEMAQKLIEDQFPEIGPVHLKLLDSGWDNIVYQVNERWLFRFPQREFAVVGVEREMQCLPVLFEILKVVPEIQFHGRATGPYPWPFFGYRPVIGKEPCDLEPVERDKLQIAASLGSLLSHLHSPQIFEKISGFVPEDPLGRLDFSKRVPMTEERLRKLREENVDLPYEDLTRILRAAMGTLKLRCSAVVHGDLHFRHLIIDEKNQLKGLIDWGDIHLNDPAADLQVYWSFMDPGERKIFLKSYGPLSEVQLVQARSFAVFVNVALLISSRAQKKDKVAREAERALHTLLQE